MKRAVLLVFVVMILAMAQKASAVQHGVTLSGGCNNYAWAWFEVGPGNFKSTFVGVRVSDGKKVVIDHYGFCGDVYCNLNDEVDESGILWKNHYITADQWIGGHLGGC